MLEINHIASSSSGNAHVFDDLLLDCGVHIDKLRENVDLTELSGCLTTHSHQDHSSATEELLRTGVSVYCSPGTAKSLGIADHHRVHQIEKLKQFYAGDWRVKAFPIEHDSEDPVGYLFQREPTKAIYLTDSAYSKYTFKGLTHILFECNFAKDILDKNVDSGTINYARKKRTIENHFSLRDVKKFLQNLDRSKLREVHLLHLSDANSDEERFKREIQELTGAVVKVAGR